MKTIEKQFCDNCWKDVDCEYHERLKEEVINKVKIKYLEKYYTCNECGNELYGDLLDYNIATAHNELRKSHNLPPIDY